MSEERRSFSDAGAFRSWLKRKHARVRVLWLVFPKKHARIKSIAYEEAVRQALCYGWIDSIIKRIDSDLCMRKFTPRTDSARWSRLNVRRAIELIESGEMTEAGYAVLPARDAVSLKRLRNAKRPDYAAVPGFIMTRLRKESRALAFFKSLPPSLRRDYVAWIMGAKTGETRRRRLEKAAGFLARGKKPML